MIRRFVNVVAKSRDTGIYSLHRVDVAKHLLYPSTAEARAAAAASGSGAPASAATTEMETLPWLPEKTMSFLPSRTWNPFFSLEHFGLVTPRRSEARILCTNSRGHALLFDADARACQHMPSLTDSKGDDPNPISFSVPRAGAGAEEAEDLYVMSACPGYDDEDPHATRFEVLELGSHEWRWVPLPPPRFVHDDDYGTVEPSSEVCAHAVVGRTICVSASHEGVGTYCFDTVTRRWRRAGGWKLPFEGGAHYVPDRDLWLGFSDHNDGYNDYSLCAVSDLATHLTAHLIYDGGVGGGEERGGGPPRLVGQWREDHHLAVPEGQEWRCQGSPRLVSLGAGRFCVANIFEDEQQVSSRHRIAVFTGVELVDDDNDTASAGMRMPRILPHKSVSYVFDYDYDCTNIQWVL